MSNLTLTYLGHGSAYLRIVLVHTPYTTYHNPAPPKCHSSKLRPQIEMKAIIISHLLAVEDRLCTNLVMNTKIDCGAAGSVNAMAELLKMIICHTLLHKNSCPSTASIWG